MFNADTYITDLIALLQSSFGDRLLYVGLQGSYLRSEATEDSDIDIMVVVENMIPSDLEKYKEAILSLDNYEKSCGFICGKEDIAAWNPLEICHLLNTTRDYYGRLSELVPTYTEYDVRSFIKLSVGNLYHELCHRYVHASTEKNVARLPYTYKSVFFILQNLYYLEHGAFVSTKKELLALLCGKDKEVLEAAMTIKNTDFDFNEKFSLLFSWCKETLARV